MLSGLCLLSMVLPLTSCGDDDEESDYETITTITPDYTLVGKTYAVLGFEVQVDNQTVSENGTPTYYMKKENMLVYLPNSANKNLKAYATFKSSVFGVIGVDSLLSKMTTMPKSVVLAGTFINVKSAPQTGVTYPLEVYFNATSALPPDLVQ